MRDVKLRELLDEFNRQFDKALDARYDVMMYLLESYGIDEADYGLELTDDYNWCDGIDERELDRLIDDATSTK